LAFFRPGVPFFRAGVAFFRPGLPFFRAGVAFFRPGVPFLRTFFQRHFFLQWHHEMAVNVSHVVAEASLVA
jgi:hypothetical protein